MNFPLLDEVLRPAKAVNTLIEQFALFIIRSMCLACEVDTECKWGGYIMAKDMSSAWKDMTESVDLATLYLILQKHNNAITVTSVAHLAEAPSCKAVLRL